MPGKKIQLTLSLMTMTIRRSYSELLNYSTFDERYQYLRLFGAVGYETFGFDRYINQRFYRSREWKSARDYVIVRDDGCDLGIPGYDIHGELLVHHMNPIVADDIIHGEEWIFDPEYLITTTHTTHNAIHYSDEKLIPKTVLSRSPGDTKLW
jgi:hypothetical protein